MMDKYRQYFFSMKQVNGDWEESVLEEIRNIDKLPDNAKKVNRKPGIEVWCTPEIMESSNLGRWTKICRIDADCDFGTNQKEEMKVIR